MDRVYEISGRGLVTLLLAVFGFGYAVGYSVWQWVLVLRGLM